MAIQGRRVCARCSRTLHAHAPPAWASVRTCAVLFIAEPEAQARSIRRNKTKGAGRATAVCPSPAKFTCTRAHLASKAMSKAKRIGVMQGTRGQARVCVISDMKA